MTHSMKRGEVGVQANYTEVEVLGKPVLCLLWCVSKLSCRLGKVAMVTVLKPRLY